MYRFSRRTIAGSEIFLGQSGKYTHEHLIAFDRYTSDLDWHELPWIKPIGNFFFEILADSARIDLVSNDLF